LSGIGDRSHRLRQTGTTGSTDEGKTNETVPSQLADDGQPPRTAKLRREEGRKPGCVTGRSALLPSGGEGGGLSGGAEEGVHVFGRWRG
jgi:hypothetical protein